VFHRISINLFLSSIFENLFLIKNRFSCDCSSASGKVSVFQWNFFKIKKNGLIFKANVFNPAEKLNTQVVSNYIFFTES
jgi:hypothetical protein